MQHRGGSGFRAPAVLARWLLLAAVLLGVLALHVLTAEDHAGTSGQLAVSGAAQVSTVPDLPVVAAVADTGVLVVAAGDPAEPTDDASLWVGCLLFVTAAAPGALALLLMLRRPRRPAAVPDHPRPGTLVVVRRDPPMLLPRLAVGVIRV